MNTKGSPVWVACLKSSETFVSHHRTNELLSQMTIRYDDIDDLLPSEYKDPWPPSDEEIEMLEWLAEQEELERSIPSAAERNPNLK